MFEIVKNRPVPNATKAPGARIYPWADMEIGDSFTIPKSELKTGDTMPLFRSRVYNSAREYGRRAQRRFVVIVDDQGDISAWRINDDGTTPVAGQAAE